MKLRNERGPLELNGEVLRGARQMDVLVSWGPLAWVALVVRLAISSARQGRAGTKLSVLSSETHSNGIPSSASKPFGAGRFAMIPGTGMACHALR